MEDISDDSVKYVYNLLTGRLDPVNDQAALREGAAQLYGLFKALTDGGFNDNQAIQILIGFLLATANKQEVYILIPKEKLPKNCHSCPYRYKSGKDDFCAKLYRNDVDEYHNSVKDEFNRRRENCPLEFGQVLWV